MPKLSQLEEIDIALKLAARDADPKVPSRQAAEEFYESNTALVEPLISEWVIEKIAKIIGRHRAKAKREANSQLVFEGLLGFKRLPSSIEIKPGESVPRAKAKIEAFRALARQVGKEKKPAYDQALRIVTLMAPYSKKNKNITWGEVAALEAEKASTKTRRAGR